MESSSHRATEKLPENLFIGGKRLDGRALEEFRRVFLKTGVISRASGSAYIEFGSTKVMVGVYGPRQSERRESYRESGRIAVDAKLASFATRQRGSFYQTPEERELSTVVQTALESVVDLDSFPKTVLDVYCTILEAGGGEAAAATTAAALAVADAGVEMRDVVTSCSVAKVKGNMVLDPSAKEESRQEAGATVAAAGASGEVAQVVVTGRWSDVELKEALELCLGGCVQLDCAARQSLKEGAERAREERMRLETELASY